MQLRPLILFLALAAHFAAAYSCAASKGARTERTLRELRSFMTGSFSSAEQAASDSAFFDISLHMYPIWKGVQEGHWLYVEQAVAAAPDRPYRQRIYKLEADGQGKFKSIVYTLKQPEQFIGAWKDPKRFESITPQDLELREGCTVLLQQTPEGDFAGATQGAGCESNLRGAAYATSEVQIRDGYIVSWDRGYNAAGKQVWGAEKGGYIFKRQ